MRSRDSPPVWARWRAARYRIGTVGGLLLLLLGSLAPLVASGSGTGGGGALPLPSRPEVGAPAPAGSGVPGVAAAIASLTTGAGPARGFPGGCVGRSGTSATCVLAGAAGLPRVGSGPPRSAAVLPPDPRGSTGTGPAGTPAWYNVSAVVNGSLAPSVVYASMAYDPALREVLLVGGVESTGGVTGEEWEYANGSWSNYSAASLNGPSARFGAMMDYDPALQSLVLFGGTNGTTTYGDLWLFDGTWREVPRTSGSPLALAFAGFAWDPALDGMLLVDGCMVFPCTLTSPGQMVYNSSGWISLAAGPTVLGHGLGMGSMAWDPVDRYMVFFGGFDGSSATNATFTDSNGTWVDISGHDAGCVGSTCFAPRGRYLASMTWDGQVDELLLVGGYNASVAAYYNNSWLFVRGEWLPTGSAGTPGAYAPAPFGGAAAPVNSTLVAPFFVGGACATPCYAAERTWDLPPVLLNATVAPNPVDESVPVWLNASISATAGSGPTRSVRVDWGNQTFGLAPAVPTPTGGTVATLTHVYGPPQGPGAYGLLVAPVDYLGVSGPGEALPLEVAPALGLTFASGPAAAEVGATVSFSVAATGGTAPYTYVWSGVAGVRPSPATFNPWLNATGTFRVLATVTDATGAQATAERTLTVYPVLAVTATIDPSPVDAGALATFDAAGQGGSGVYANASWTFGDGSGAPRAVATYRYPAPGNFTAAASVTDSAGSSARTLVPIVVHPALAVVLLASDRTATLGEAVALGVRVSNGTPPYTYLWSFGDGAASAAPSPVHFYAATGTFTVRIWINDSGGGSVVTTETVEVRAPPSAWTQALGALTSGLGLAAAGGAMAVVAGVVVLRRRAARRSRAQTAGPDPRAPRSAERAGPEDDTLN